MVWELAGVVGVDPGPLTLRELVWMAEARGRADWSRTASLMALVANTNRDPKKTRPFRPSDFDPHAAGSGKSDGIELSQMSDLKEAFRGLKGRES